MPPSHHRTLAVPYTYYSMNVDVVHNSVEIKKCLIQERTRRRVPTCCVAVHPGAEHCFATIRSNSGLGLVAVVA